MKKLNKFRKIFLILLTFILSIGSYIGYSQCSNFGSNYPTGNFTTTSDWTTVSTTIYASEWAYYNLTGGVNYEWSTCPGDGGGNTWDSQLTLWNNVGNGYYAYNDDYCGTSSKIGWTASTTTTVQVLLSRYNCTITTLYENPSNTIVWRATPPSGTITTSTTSVCQAGSVTFTATNTSPTSVNGFTPSFRYFEYNWDGNTWSGLVLSTSTPYNWTSSYPGHILNVRAVFGNGSVLGYSSTVSVRVDAASSYGTLNTSGPVKFCSSDSSFAPAVSISGYVGTPTWSWGSNNGAWNSWGGGASSGTCCFPKQTSTSDGNPDRTRVTVQNGVCASVTSPTILLYDYYNESPTSLTSNINNVCTGTSGTLTATFPSAVNMRGFVEFSTSLNGTPFTTITPTGQTIFTSNITPPVGLTTYYVRYNAATNVAGCYSNSVTTTVNVYALSNAGTVTQNPGTGGSICLGGNVSYTQSGGIGSFNNFEYQWDGTGGSWTTWGSTNPYNWISGVNNVTNTLYVRAKVTNGTCTSAYSSPVSVTVLNNIATSGSIYPNNSSVCQNTSITINSSVNAITSAGTTLNIKWYRNYNGVWTDLGQTNNQTLTEIPPTTPGTYTYLRRSWTSCASEGVPSSYDATTTVTVTQTDGSSQSNPINAGTIGCTPYTNSINTSSCYMNNYNGTNNLSYNDIWYSFTIPTSSYMSLSTCGSGFDTYTRLWDGSNQIALNDDGGPICGTYNEGSMIYNCSPGTYYFVLEGYYQNGSINTSISYTDLGTANVGVTQNITGVLVSNPLGGNTPIAGFGTWSKISGIGNVVFSDPNSGSSTATVSTSDTYVYRWTFPANGTCGSSYADITVDYSGMLPIELMEFKGMCVNNTNTISWTTASETNNDYFTIERSNDGLTWRILETIDGQGNSIIMKSYSILDKNPLDITYYRLTQTDFNGQSETFDPIVVKCREDIIEKNVIIYPNPFNSIVSINLYNISDENIIINIYDLSGKLLKSENYTIINDFNILNLDLNYLSDGSYFIEVKSSNYIKVEKIIKN